MTDTKTLIKLSKKTDEMIIEVLVTDESEFAEAYALLKKLCQRAGIEKVRDKIKTLWISDGASRQINESVSNGVHRVALSLLENWPECKRPKSIQDDTGLSSGSVSNILVGRQGNCNDWFMKCDEGWTLSQQGISNILDTLIPKNSANQKEE
ncbi:MAG: hypothetical protein ACTSWA_03385 [Candidatus Thorarchaeota archaeon]